MEPVGHLLSMSTELALKAYLLERRMTEKELGSRKIGHDLGEILRNCIERGLGLSEADVMHVLAMRTAHLEHYHRYGPRTLDGGAYTIVLPKEEEALYALARIIDLIAQDPSDLRALHERPVDLDWPLTTIPAKLVTIERFKALAAEAEEYAKKIEKLGVPHF